MEGSLLPPQHGMHKGRPTLVLDLDNTLIDGRVSRPGLTDFMRAVKEHYEIVIFTAGTKDCAEKNIDAVNIDGCIAHRLYGESCVEYLVKPMAKLGRPLSKVVAVDDMPHTYRENPDNALPVTGFFEQNVDTDDELPRLASFLVSIANEDDLRSALRQKKWQNDHPATCTQNLSKNKSTGKAGSALRKKGSRR